MVVLLLLRFKYRCWVAVLIVRRIKARARSGHCCLSLLTIEMRQNQVSCVEISNLMLWIGCVNGRCKTLFYQRYYIPGIPNLLPPL